MVFSGVDGEVVGGRCRGAGYACGQGGGLWRQVAKLIFLEKSTDLLAAAVPL